MKEIIKMKCADCGAIEPPKVFVSELANSKVYLRCGNCAGARVETW